MNIIEELAMELASVSFAQTAQVKLTEEPHPGEIVVGVLTPDLQRFFCLMKRYQRRIHLAMADLVMVDGEAHKAALANIARTNGRLACVSEMFWLACREHFPETLTESVPVAVRAGFKFVKGPEPGAVGPRVTIIPVPMGEAPEAEPDPSSDRLN